MAHSDIVASTVMAVPGPFMQLCLNTGLALVVIIGARRVNGGLMRPGVILAFLTYFNMITMGVMGLSRIFMTMSKASASANRIEAVLQTETDQRVLPESELKQPAGDEFIRFEDVRFSYASDSDETPEEAAADFAGEKRENAIDGISFALRRGESLGIIGPTGCGKTTIINLLMRFYDADEGGVFVDGKDVRGYDKDELRRRFGVSFQNDVVFWDTLRENINFGRDLDETAIRRAVEDAMAAEYIDELDEGLDYKASILGANLSGGQKQRVILSRALAGDPEILVLDDSSSALDYATDARLRLALREHFSGKTTNVIVAQRISSILHSDLILVMEDGHVTGRGTHAELLRTCPLYREISDSQMGGALLE
jgi:ATP-binding cassette subfamily B protein